MPRVCLWPRGVPAARLFLPKSVQKGLTCGPTNGSRSTPRRYPAAETRALKGHSIHRRRRSYRSTCKSDDLPASHRVFFRGSGPRRGDLFTWTIPPACFTIDSHDTSLALLRSLECYHLTFITARLCIKFCSMRLKGWLRLGTLKIDRTPVAMY